MPEINTEEIHDEIKKNPFQNPGEILRGTSKEITEKITTVILGKKSLKVPV